MKAFSCPQCGGLIKNIGSRQTVAECDYCGAQVGIDEPESFNFAALNFRAIERGVRPSQPPQAIFIAIAAVGSVFFVIFLAAFLASKPHSAARTPTESLKPLNYPAYSQTPDKNDESAALTFGGKGGSAGVFDGARAIAAGKNGDIYVADKTMRVQRFDGSGKYLNAWIVKGEKNETIDKIAASTDGEVYVLIGGEIVVYTGETGKQLRVLSDSRRHYIDDFVLSDSNELTCVAEGEPDEQFVQMKGKEIINRFAGIHSVAAEAKIPAAGIKIAVGNNNDIFSVYAVASLNGTLEYNDGDLMTFHFSPSGKFVNKFAADLMPMAILADNQNRVYILTRNEIAVFSSSGSELKRIKTAGFVSAFAIDNQNNLYTVSGDVVRKLKPVDFGI